MAQQPILDGLAKIRLPDLHRSSTPRHLLGFLDHGFVNIDCTALPGISEGRALGIGIKAVQKDVNEATTVRQKDLVIKG